MAEKQRRARGWRREGGTCPDGAHPTLESAGPGGWDAGRPLRPSGFPQPPGLICQGWWHGQEPGSHQAGRAMWSPVVLSRPPLGPPGLAFLRQFNPGWRGQTRGGTTSGLCLWGDPTPHTHTAEVGGRVAHAAGEGEGADGGEGAAPAAAEAARTRLPHLLRPVRASVGEQGRAPAGQLSLADAGFPV